MNDPIALITNIIQSDQSITNEQKSMIASVIEKFPPDALMFLSEQFTKDPDSLRLFAVSLEAKRQALTSGDTPKFNDIVQNELDTLED